MMNPVNETNGVITYAAGPERYAELLEREAVSPSVEFPRSQWVQVERWDVFRQRSGRAKMEARTRLSRQAAKRTRDVLAMRRASSKRVIEERERRRWRDVCNEKLSRGDAGIALAGQMWVAARMS